MRAASLLVIGIVLGFASLAFSQCRNAEEIDAFRTAFERSLRCSGPTCGGSGIPSCAGTFAEDLRGLAGAGNTRCERQIQNSTVEYVWTKYDRIVRHGDPLPTAETIAARAWDRLNTACQVAVSRKGEGSIPAVGPQCAGTLGPPGSMVDSQQLAACLHHQVQAWFDLRYGPFAEPEFPR